MSILNRKTLVLAVMAAGVIATGASLPVHGQTGSCEKETYWELATPPGTTTGTGSDDGGLTGFFTLSPWHNSSSTKYSVNGTAGATTFNHYYRVKLADEADFPVDWEISTCTTGPANGSRCTAQTLVRKPFVAGGECGFNPGGAFSPPNRVDDIAPKCGTTWSGSGSQADPYRISGSSDEGGSQIKSEGSCFGGVGSTCKAEVKDNADNNILCESPVIKGPLSCSPSAQSKLTGEDASFTASDPSVSPANSAAPYTWSVDGAQASQTGLTFHTSFSTAGQKRVTVRNSEGATAACTVQVTDQFQVPGGVSCTASPASTQTGRPVNFTVTDKTTHPGGPYAWEVAGTSMTGTGATFQATFQTAGTKTITVKNGDGIMGSCTVAVTKSFHAGCTDPTSITVRSNIYSTWKINGPDASSTIVETASSTGNTYYVSATGTYTFLPHQFPNYGATVTPASSLPITSCGQNIEFDVTYGPAYPPNCAPTLVVTPPSAQVNVGSSTTFQALYDKDGPGCYASGNRDVTAYATWSALNTAIAQAGTSGQFTGLTSGQTGIRARYMDPTDPFHTQLTGNATLNVIAVVTPDFSCDLLPDSISVPQGGSASGVLRCQPKNGFTGPASLTTGSVPPASTLTFTPTSFSFPPSTVDIPYLFKTTSSTPIGAVTTPITGTKGALSHTYPLFIAVTGGTTLTADLAASPASGASPLSSTLTATVGGTATGTINYTFWWNCGYTGTSVAAAISQCGDPASSGAKFDGISENPKSTAPHIYLANATPRVIVERGGKAASAAAGITISQGATHAECVQSACVQVSGAGIDRCGASADCGGGGGGPGGGGGIHGYCDPVQKACVNRSGSGVSCSSDACAGGGSGNTHLECQNNACVIVSGAGTNASGCSKVGDACTPPVLGTCSFGVPSGSDLVSSVFIKKGQTAVLTWRTCGGSCAITEKETGKVVKSNGPAGSFTVAPAKTTTYVLNCSGQSKALETVVNVSLVEEVPPGGH